MGDNIYNIASKNSLWLVLKFKFKFFFENIKKKKACYVPQTKRNWVANFCLDYFFFWRTPFWKFYGISFWDWWNGANCGTQGKEVWISTSGTKQ